MEGGRRAKQALSWIPEGSRKIGRPRITWNDNITKEDIENNGVTWEEAFLLMQAKMEELDCPMCWTISLQQKIWHSLLCWNICSRVTEIEIKTQ